MQRGTETAFPRHETRQAASVQLTACGRSLEGYASIFHEVATIGDFQEVVLPGAFTKALSSDVLCLVDHDPAKVLGRTRSGTLQLREDAKGLRFTVDLPDTTLARDMLEMVKRGDVGGCSFGFVVPRGGEHWQGKRRELRSVTLLEISIVSAWPAYSGTTVQARSQAHPKTQALKRLLETL